MANEIGVNESTVSRYEHGKADISASTMAYISYACEFPMREYVEKYDPEHLPGDEVVPIDEVFNNAAGQEAPTSKASAVGRGS